MEENTVTLPAIIRALRHLEALKAAIPPENTELLAMANKAQREVLSVTLRGITDDARRTMMLEAAGVEETKDGGMTASNIFKYDQPHLVAAEAVANAIGWIENAGYVVIKDPSLDDVDEE